jgi:formiminotetrahydrofolate cyclodeaminase
VAARTTAPGGGASAALTAALAAALTAMAARFDDDSPAAARTVERAEQLRGQASALVEADVAAYGEFVAARRRYGPDSSQALEALEGAVDVPLRIVRTAAEVAGLARSTTVDGNPRLRGDASTGCWLAAASASAAAGLVAENLADAPDDGRVAEARADAARARAAAARLGDDHPAAGP